MSDYESFLNRANADVSQPPSGRAGASGTAAKKTQTVVTAEVPSGLSKVVEGKGLYYTSDADEPFEVVALEVKGVWKGDEASFASLIDRPTDAVECLTRKDFDPRGEYDAVFEAVQQAAGSGAAERVRVFRVQLDGTRAEYFVVAADAAGTRVVGLKAVAVES